MDDLAQLEKILFRFATSDTDESLEKTLAKHLAPSLFKLSSQDEAVRKKCMELLVHVNKRVKNNDNIQLPMEGLLEQYRNPNSTSFIINFTIIYIKMGFPRLPLERKVEHIPKLLHCLEDKPASHQESILVMILPFLEHLKCSSENPESKSNYLNLSKTVSKLFCDFIFDFLLLPYGSHPSIKPADPNDKIQVPPGLSEAAWKKVAGETLMKPEELEKVKTNVVKFLGNGLISEKEIAMHLVIAMADTRHSVSTEADSVMRRFSGGIDWNDKVHKLSVFSITNIITISFYLFLFRLPGSGEPTVRRISWYFSHQRQRWKIGHNYFWSYRCCAHQARKQTNTVQHSTEIEANALPGEVERGCPLFSCFHSSDF